ncbi:signal recognition particle 19 kDa protein-like [Homalodisca vitripennis]|uniref:signal recognition particle 19 kDa protein-like n=1 Tax=Homalodisca vitripennis TaxID=197043 RepID=UPI001EEA0AC9|nr:signal recognition particle 19 kDa protein-like [Homalodisca vitripennis]
MFTPTRQMLVYRYALRLQHNEDYDSTSTWDSSSEEDFWGEVGDRPSNMSVVVSMWTPDKKHSDRERWICIYPAYINSKKTIAEGRRIPKDKAVENPTHQEIRDVLVAAGLNIGVENKVYSRERSREVLYRGRIRVQLKNDDGSLVNKAFPTRDSVMLYLGAMIPKLKCRAGKQSVAEYNAYIGQSSQVTSTKKKGKRR